MAKTQYVIYIQSGMHIDSPSFVRRRNIYNIQENTSSNYHMNNSQEHSRFPYGEQRQLIAAYVKGSLNAHKNDLEILQKFRKEAEQRKKDYFLAKIGNRKGEKANSQPKRTNQQSCYIKNQQVATESRSRKSKMEKIIKDQTQSQQSFSQQQAIRAQQANKFKKLLKEKQKQLQKKDKKLQKFKNNLKALTKRIQHLQSQARYEEQNQSDINIVGALLENINSKLAQNRRKIHEQINKIVPPLQYSHQLRNQSQRQVRPPNKDYKKALIKIKQTAKQIRQQSPINLRNKSNPSVIYKYSSQKEGKNYLDDLSASMLKEKKFENSRKIYFPVP